MTSNLLELANGVRAKPSARAFVLRMEPLRVSTLRASIAFAGRAQ